MAGSSRVEVALRRDRLLVVVGLALVVVVSWGYLLAGAGMMEEMGGMLMPMSSGPWTHGHVLVVAVMWVAMMAAMMLKLVPAGHWVSRAAGALLVAWGLATWSGAG